MLNKREAKADGARAGKAAASWLSVDTEAGAERLRGMLDDGDPQADEYMPRRPDLSGEFAGESMNEILYVESDDDPDDVDEIAAIWEEAAALAYDKEIYRILNAYAPRRRRRSRPAAPKFNRPRSRRRR